MINISKLDTSEISSAKLLASICYQPSLSVAKQKCQSVPLKRGLYNTGHHTTFESTHHTFMIESIPVSLVTFGLHMNHPFYNSLQRSGRYCTDMFNSDTLLPHVSEFIDKYLIGNDFNVADRLRLITYVFSGVKLYQDYIDIITEDAILAIVKERPNLPSKVINMQATRFAQEQLRCVISTITPTGLAHTLSTIALASMYNVSWNQPLRDILFDMVKLSTTGTELEFILDGVRPINHWVPTMSTHDVSLAISPIVSNVSGKHPNILNTIPDKLNLSPYDPHTSDTLDDNITTEISTSIMSYGQDQRHRTIERSNPHITCSLYIPPLLRRHSELVARYSDIKQNWISMTRHYGLDKLIHFIPYGSMVKYTERATTKAFHHKTAKRLCLKSQEEIYEVARLSNIANGTNLSPPCISRRCRETVTCGRVRDSDVSRDLI